MVLLVNGHPPVTPCHIFASASPLIAPRPSLPLAHRLAGWMGGLLSCQEPSQAACPQTGWMGGLLSCQEPSQNLFDCMQGHWPSW